MRIGIRSLHLGVYLLGLVALAAAPLAMLSAIIALEFVTVQQREQGLLLNEGARSLTAQIDVRVGAAINALTMLASASNSDGADLHEFREDGRLLLAGHDYWRSLSLHASSGAILSELRAPSLQPSVQDGVSPDVKVTAGTDPLGTGYLEVALPVHSMGADAASLCVRIDLDGIAAAATPPGELRRWAAAILDRSGTVIASTLPALRGHPLRVSGSAGDGQEARLVGPPPGWGLTDVVLANAARAPLRVAYLAPGVPLARTLEQHFPPVIALIAIGFALPVGVIVLGVRSLEIRVRRLARDAARVAGRAPMPERRPSGVREIDMVRDVLHNAHRAVLDRAAGEARLHQAEIALVQSQRAQSVHLLMSGIAHDFGNLTLAISGQLQVVRRRVSEDPQLGPLIEQAMALTTEAGTMMRELITAARAGTPEAEPTILNDLIGANADLLRRVAGPRVQLEVALAPDLWPCRVNHGLARSAVFNLVVNARAAMPDGGTLRIATGNMTIAPGVLPETEPAPPGEYVLLTVQDSGIGMTPRTRERIFDPFFSTRSAEGSGLGLTMVREFVMLSGGAVQVDSEPGVGTLFRLYFPRSA